MSTWRTDIDKIVFIPFGNEMIRVDRIESWRAVGAVEGIDPPVWTGVPGIAAKPPTVYVTMTSGTVHEAPMTRKEFIDLLKEAATTTTTKGTK